MNDDERGLVVGHRLSEHHGAGEREGEDAHNQTDALHR
jgi:hypothetical protein